MFTEIFNNSYVILGLIFLSVTLTTALLVIIGQGLLASYETRYTGRMGGMMEELFIFQNAKIIFWINMIGALLAVLFCMLLSRNVLLTIIAGVIGFNIPRIFLFFARKRRYEKFDRQFVDALNVLANGLRSGMTLVQSVEIVEKEFSPPLSQEFGLALRENRLGVPIEDALVNMSKRIPNDDLRLVTISINTVFTLGGNLVELFTNIAVLIRERAKFEKKTKALTAQGKMQGIVVGFLPTGLGILLFFADPSLMNYMFGTAVGIIALVAMILLQLIGFFLIQKITAIEI